MSIQTSFPVSMELFTSYREIATDQSKVGKVMRTILMRLGSEVYEQICLAAVSADEDRELPFIMCCTGLLGEADAKTCNGGTGRSICIQGCENGTLREAGISPLFWVCPFQEIGGRFLLAKIQPGNDILSLMALHFSNRFPNENWVIYDEKRQKALCHEKGKECVMRKEVRIQVPGSAVGIWESTRNCGRHFVIAYPLKQGGMRNFRSRCLLCIFGVICRSFL